MSHSISVALAPLTPDSEALATTTAESLFEARGIRRIVASSVAPDLVECLPLNGLLMALHVAYTRHRALTLSPDDIWNAIAQAMGRHIAEHAEELRSRFVRHEGKEKIEVRRDELAEDPASEAHWAAAVADLTAEVKKHLGGRADLFVASFSTTDARSRTASSIALLGAVQSYFEYVVTSLCGIPRIILRGTPDDWANVRVRARVVSELGVDWWTEKLDEVLAEIEATARGNANVSFWERIYKVHNASGGEAISGWINALFPYLGDEGTQRNPWFVVGDRGNDLEFPKLKSFPSGLASAPFTWNRLQVPHAMTLTGGFVGVSRTEGDGVRPALGWIVSHAQAPRRFRALPRHGGGVQLMPRSPITDLTGLAEEIAQDNHQRVEVSISWSETLRSLDGLQDAPVEALSLLSCSLESIEALTTARSLRRVWIQQCGKLTDLGPLATMELDQLAINHCPMVRDYRPLATVRGLQQLDLFGDSVPSSLRGRHVGDAIFAVQKALASLPSS